MVRVKVPKRSAPNIPGVRVGGITKINTSFPSGYRQLSSSMPSLRSSSSSTLGSGGSSAFKRYKGSGPQKKRMVGMTDEELLEEGILDIDEGPAMRAPFEGMKEPLRRGRSQELMERDEFGFVKEQMKGLEGMGGGPRRSSAESLSSAAENRKAQVFYNQMFGEGFPPPFAGQKYRLDVPIGRADDVVAETPTVRQSDAGEYVEPPAAKQETVEPTTVKDETVEAGDRGAVPETPDPAAVATDNKFKQKFDEFVDGIGPKINKKAEEASKVAKEKINQGAEKLAEGLGGGAAAKLAADTVKEGLNAAVDVVEDGIKEATKNISSKKLWQKKTFYLAASLIPGVVTSSTALANIQKEAGENSALASALSDLQTFLDTFQENLQTTLDGIKDAVTDVKAAIATLNTDLNDKIGDLKLVLLDILAILQSVLNQGGQITSGGEGGTGRGT